MTNAAPKTTLSRELAEFAIGLRLADVPSDIVVKAKTHLLDTLGIGLASSGFDFAGPVLAGARLLGEGSRAHAIGSGAALPPAGAALVNGTLFHGLDFDDTHIGAIYHTSAPALAAALAAGEAAGATGEELLVTYIAALEIGCRLARAASGGFHDRGFHPTALIGTFAATFAAGRLMGASVDALVSAVGLAGSMSAGLLELKASWLKRLHPGWAAHSGVSAASLAISGFLGPATMLDGGHGFYHAHLGTIPSGDLWPAKGLGSDWLVAGIALKPYPCCHFIHGFVDCAFVLRDQVAIDDIVSIDCPLSARLHPLVAGPAHPSEPYAAMFSVPYVVALALVEGVVDLASFHDKGVDDPRVTGLAERIAISDDPASDFPARFPGEIRITLRDGRVVSHRVASSFGTPDWPMRYADVEEKFRANAGRVATPIQADAIISCVDAIEQTKGVADLMKHLVVPPANQCSD